MSDIAPAAEPLISKVCPSCRSFNLLVSDTKGGCRWSCALQPVMDDQPQESASYTEAKISGVETSADHIWRASCPEFTHCAVAALRICQKHWIQTGA